MLRLAQHEDLSILHPELVEGFSIIFLHPQPYIEKTMRIHTTTPMLALIGSLYIIVTTVTFAQNNRSKEATNIDLLTLVQQQRLQSLKREILPLSEGDKKGVRFLESSNDGLVWLDGLDFTNGTIELDLKGRDVFQQSFLGVAFHRTNDTTFDIVYFRPFNFNSSDSVRRIHAVQYVSLPVFKWEKLRAEYNGKYEKAIISAPPPNEWFHAKIVIKYPRVQVFVNNHAEPSLNIEQLSNQRFGKIGLWISGRSSGDFANLSVTAD